jgi:hypothetical protein
MNIIILCTGKIRENDADLFQNDMKLLSETKRKINKFLHDPSKIE